MKFHNCHSVFFKKPNSRKVKDYSIKMAGKKLSWFHVIEQPGDFILWTIHNHYKNALPATLPFFSFLDFEWLVNRNQDKVKWHLNASCKLKLKILVPGTKFPGFCSELHCWFLPNWALYGRNRETAFPTHSSHLLSLRPKGKLLEMNRIWGARENTRIYLVVNEHSLKKECFL